MCRPPDPMSPWMPTPGKASAGQACTLTEALETGLWSWGGARGSQAWGVGLGGMHPKTRLWKADERRWETRGGTVGVALAGLEGGKD